MTIQRAVPMPSARMFADLTGDRCPGRKTTILLDLVLASQSASRRAMLDAAGVGYAAIPAHVDEAAVKQALVAEGQSARAIADALAELKKLLAARR